MALFHLGLQLMSSKMVPSNFLSLFFLKKVPTLLPFASQSPQYYYPFRPTSDISFPILLLYNKFWAIKAELLSKQEIQLDKLYMNLEYDEGGLY